MATEQLPVPILGGPYWRVNVRPDGYEAERIPTLSECLKAVERAKVRLRGWDYPHLSNRSEDFEYGENWVASWVDFRGHREYWRIYQSAQFVHLFSVREALEPAWREQLANTWEFEAGAAGGGSEVPGFLSVVNFLWRVTEIFEFAARLCEAGVFDRSVALGIELRGIRGFRLSEPQRTLYGDYAATRDEIGRTWDLGAKELLSASAERALDAVVWFFERFGWLDPPVETLRQDQERLLQKKL